MVDDRVLASNRPLALEEYTNELVSKPKDEKGEGPGGRRARCVARSAGGRDRLFSRREACVGGRVVGLGGVERGRLGRNAG